VTLVAPTLDSRFVDALPLRLIGDRAYDADPLDEALLEQLGIEMIAPHRRGRKRPKSPRRPPAAAFSAPVEGRTALCRAFATSVASSFATSAMRESYLGFVLLGCILILLRQH
jgi:transposase